MPVPLAIPIALGGAAFLKWLAGNSANNDAMNKGYEALNQAQGAIQGAADKGVALQQPYLQNAGADYGRQRGLVQSGYYQTPYGQSFNPQQMSRSGFSFNPGQGTASFMPQGGGLLNSFTPQGLPPMPALPSQTPATTGTQGPAGGGIQMPKIDANVIRDLVNSSRPISPMPMSPNVLNTTPGAGYNPQTEQNNPLTDMGVKPADPRFPSAWATFQLAQKYPWLMGRSGPLEGGMPGRGLL